MWNVCINCVHFKNVGKPLMCIRTIFVYAYSVLIHKRTTNDVQMCLGITTSFIYHGDHRKKRQNVHFLFLYIAFEYPAR